jgi:hypothetical protein
MTTIEIDGDDWLIDGEVTHEGRYFRGRRIEGLLLNSRMANGIFDDANPLTRHLWAYPDTGAWDPERNTDELIAMLPVYKSYGLDCICVNLQGASPVGYYRNDPASLADLLVRVRAANPGAREEEVWAGLAGDASQPWESGAIATDGQLKPDFMDRAERLIRAADDCGMAVMLGIFYFGQDERIRDEAAVRWAVEATCKWVLAKRFENVIIEISNETNVPRYEHEILTPPRVHELIALAKSVASGDRRLLAGASFARMSEPTDAVIAESDYILLHGNGIHEPPKIAERVEVTVENRNYNGQPIVYNEDDHFDFDKPENNFLAALSRHASWGFFDPGPGAGGSAAYGNYEDGYQNPPVNWSLNNERKRAFFEFLGEVTGERATE